MNNVKNKETFRKYYTKWYIALKTREHQEYLNEIFFLFRWYHKIFVSWRCPACIENKKDISNE